MKSINHEQVLWCLKRPTVGVDVVLSNKIWTHFRSLAKNMAIIISTHDMDEAKKVDVVAFMKSGKIIAENDPKILVEGLGVESLQEVFIKLWNVKECDLMMGNVKLVLKSSIFA